MIQAQPAVPEVGCRSELPGDIILGPLSDHKQMWQLADMYMFPLCDRNEYMTVIGCLR